LPTLPMDWTNVGLGTISRSAVNCLALKCYTFAALWFTLSALLGVAGAKAEEPSAAVHTFFDAVSRNELATARDTAIETLAHASVRTDPKLMGAWHDRAGYVFILIDDTESAKRHYDSACTLTGASQKNTLAECKAGLALIEITHGNGVAAVRLAKEALLFTGDKDSGGPSVALASMALGLERLRSNDAPQAERWLLKSASSVIFKAPNAHPQLANMLTQLLVKTAEVYFQIKKPKEAVRNYRKSFDFASQTLSTTDPNLLDRLIDISDGLGIYVQNSVIRDVTSSIFAIAVKTADDKKSQLAVSTSIKNLQFAGYNDDATTFLWMWQAYAEGNGGIRSVEAANGLIQIGEFLYHKGQLDVAEKLFDKGLGIIEHSSGKNSDDYEKAKLSVDILLNTAKANKQVVDDYRKDVDILVNNMKLIEKCALDENAEGCTEKLNAAELHGKVSNAIANAQKAGGTDGLKGLLDEWGAVKKTSITTTTRRVHYSEEDQAIIETEALRLVDAGLEIGLKGKYTAHWTFRAMVSRKANYLKRVGNYLKAIDIIDQARSEVRTTYPENTAALAGILSLFPSVFSLIPTSYDSKARSMIAQTVDMSFSDLQKIVAVSNPESILVSEGISSLLEFGSFYKDRRNADAAGRAFRSAKRLSQFSSPLITDVEREEIREGLREPTTKSSAQAAPKLTQTPKRKESLQQMADRRWREISKIDDDDLAKDIDSTKDKTEQLEEVAEELFQKPDADKMALKFMRAAFARNRADLIDQVQKLPLTNSDELRSRRRRIDRSLFLHLRLLARSEKLGHSPTSAELEEAFGILQTRRVGLAAEASLRSAARVAVGPVLSKLVRKFDESVLDWRAARDELSASSVRENDAAGLRGLTEKLARSHAQAVEANKTLIDNSIDYRELVKVDGVSLAYARRMLAPREGLLVFAFDKDIGFVGMLVTTKGAKLVDLGINLDTSSSRYESLVSGEPLVRLVSKLKASMIGEQPTFDFDSAESLYRAVIAPFGKDLTEVDRLVIVPDSVLISIPFPALVEKMPIVGASADGISWLIKKYSISLSLSPKNFVALRLTRHDQSADDPFVGFAAPVIESANCLSTTAWGSQLVAERTSSPTCSLPPIPQTLDQVKVLANALGADLAKSIFSGPRMTKANVIEALTHPVRVIAFATHGLLTEELFREAKIAEPALMLSGMTSDESSSERWLTASNIASISIDADLVVLSACNTGSGASLGASEEESEALSGLPRAFFEAGARGVLVTYWSIEAYRTAETLAAAASSLARSPNKGIADALRDGMLAQLGKVGNPRDWAMFAYFGR
jgi:CHAT domain-containing protein/tetratricopeptide (TPR) repeat protein